MSYQTEIVRHIIDVVVPETITNNTAGIFTNALTGADNKIFGIKGDKQNNEIVVTAKTGKMINHLKLFKSAFTTEAIEDIFAVDKGNDAMFKHSIAVTGVQISNYIDSISIPTMRMLAKPVPNITFGNDKESNYFNLMFHIQQCLVDINVNVKRGIKGYAILSPIIAANFSQFVSIYNMGDVSNKGRVNYMGSTQTVDFYCDPYAADGDVIVGYRSGSLKGDSGLIVAHQGVFTNKSIDYETGDTYFWTNVRTGLVRNPLDSGTKYEDSDFIRKFKVDVTPLQTNNFVSKVVDNVTVEHLGNTDTFSVNGEDITRVFINGIMTDNFIIDGNNGKLKEAPKRQDEISIERVTLA